jgi:hypothetical protein
MEKDIRHRYSVVVKALSTIVFLFVLLLWVIVLPMLRISPTGHSFGNLIKILKHFFQNWSFYSAAINRLMDNNCSESESVNRRRTDITMTKRKRTKGQKTIYKKYT